MESEKKEIRFDDKPIKIECNSMKGETDLIGIYKTKVSFRAFDAFGNWFTVTKLPYDVQLKLAVYIHQYNHKY